MNIEIANKLLQLRKERLFTRSLSSRIRISRQAVSKWERAEASLMNNLIELAVIWYF
ncbi:MAG: hypothetical protein ACLUIS_05345 [Longibaculum sp.]